MELPDFLPSCTLTKRPAKPPGWDEVGSLPVGGSPRKPNPRSYFRNPEESPNQTWGVRGEGRLPWRSPYARKDWWLTREMEQQEEITCAERGCV